MARHPRHAPNAAKGRRWALGAAFGAALAAALLPAAGPRAEDAAGSGPSIAGASKASDAPRLDEYAVKAAFLYNFAKFTRWPETAFANAWAPLRVCVLGRDPFGPTLETIAGKRVGTRRLAVHRLAAGEPADGCHMVFLAGGVDMPVTGAAEGLGGRPVLTVSDGDGAAADFGSMIRFHVIAEKIRFHVDTQSAQDAGLGFSARLLRLSQPPDNASAGIAATPAG